MYLQHNDIMNRIIIAITALCLCGFGALAEPQMRPLAPVATSAIADTTFVNRVIGNTPQLDMPAESVSDSLLRVYNARADYDPFDMPLSLPAVFFMPIV